MPPSEGQEAGHVTHHCHHRYPSEVASFHPVTELWTVLKGRRGSVPAEIKIWGLQRQLGKREHPAPRFVKCRRPRCRWVSTNVGAGMSPPLARDGARAWLGQAADPGRWEVLLGPAPAHPDANTTATSQNRTPPLTWPGLKVSNPDGFGLCLPRVLLLAPGSPPQAMPAKAIPSPSSGAGAAIAGGQNVPPSEAEALPVPLSCGSTGSGCRQLRGRTDGQLLYCGAKPEMVPARQPRSPEERPFYSRCAAHSARQSRPAKIKNKIK